MCARPAGEAADRMDADESAPAPDHPGKACHHGVERAQDDDRAGDRQERRGGGAVRVGRCRGVGLRGRGTRSQRHRGGHRHDDDERVEDAPPVPRVGGPLRLLTAARQGRSRRSQPGQDEEHDGKQPDDDGTTQAARAAARIAARVPAAGQERDSRRGAQAGRRDHEGDGLDDLDRKQAADVRAARPGEPDGRAATPGEGGGDQAERPGARDDRADRRQGERGPRDRALGPVQLDQGRQAGREASRAEAAGDSERMCRLQLAEIDREAVDPDRRHLAEVEREAPAVAQVRQERPAVEPRVGVRREQPDRVVGELLLRELLHSGGVQRRVAEPEGIGRVELIEETDDLGSAVPEPVGARRQDELVAHAHLEHARGRPRQADLMDEILAPRSVRQRYHGAVRSCWSGRARHRSGSRPRSLARS